MANHGQTIPLRIYETDAQIMVAAPMPGLEAEDISVTIRGDQIEIQGAERGPRQHERDLLLDEWTIGPYHRKISLSRSVDGPLSNATYGNGVLVLSMPKIEAGREAAQVDFQLQPIAPARGERIGHTGKDMQPTTTQQHARKHNAAENPPRKSSSS